MKRLLVNYKNIKPRNIYLLTSLEIKKLIGSPFKFLIFFLVFCVILLISKHYFVPDNKKIEIGIVNEDNSKEITVMLANFENSKLAGSANFTYFDKSSGKKALKNNEIIALVFVPKDTTHNLNYGEKARIELLVNGSDFETNYLVSYMKRMIELFNEAQSRAVYYLEVMREDDKLSDENIYDNFNSLSEQIFFAFMTRGSVINEENGINIDFMSKIINVFILMFVVISVFFSYFDCYDDRVSGKRARLIRSGYKRIEYTISRLITSVVLNIIFIAFITLFIYVFFPSSTDKIISNRFMYLLLLGLFLSILYETFSMFDVLKGYTPVVVITALVAFSSVFSIVGYFPKFIRNILEFNFVSIFYNLAKGYKLSFFYTLSLFIWFLLILVFRKLVVKSSEGI